VFVHGATSFTARLLLTRLTGMCAKSFPSRNLPRLVIDVARSCSRLGNRNAKCAECLNIWGVRGDELGCWG